MDCNLARDKYVSGLGFRLYVKGSSINRLNRAKTQGG